MLGDLSVGEFTRLMVSITAWVAPQQGCTYCHNADDRFSSDALYTKVVARRMLQMTRHINATWKPHVADTGVTCYTCHRGQPVPANIWFMNAGSPHASGYAGNQAGQNAPAPAVGYHRCRTIRSRPFLDRTRTIRVVSTAALPERQSPLDQADRVDLRPDDAHVQVAGRQLHVLPQHAAHSPTGTRARRRATVAWYGIRMVRDLNTHYLDPLASTFPAKRALGPDGDAPGRSTARPATRAPTSRSVARACCPTIPESAKCARW